MRRARQQRFGTWLGVYPKGMEWWFGLADACEYPRNNTGYIYRSLAEVKRAKPDFLARRGRAVTIVKAPDSVKRRWARLDARRPAIAMTVPEILADQVFERRRVRNRLRALVPTSAAVGSRTTARLSMAASAVASLEEKTPFPTWPYKTHEGRELASQHSLYTCLALSLGGFQ